MTEEKKQIPDLAVLGINVGIFAIYTAIGVYSNGDSWFVISLWHAAVCVLMAIIQKRWIWVLAALVVLIIGFATCVNTFHLDTK